ncbi:aspartate aminotransferase family protein [Streptomyces oceani]|uniref:Acetylornithine aminotransferase n=1 Tax=Streptomyces oceani TaxID=1075402 RepID=A0A1E7KPK0_9ACTN|nr:acetylornithine aminotransferase [Streptomyces oceani]
MTIDTAPPQNPSARTDASGFDFHEVVKTSRAHLNKGRAAVAEMLGGHSEVASEGAYLFGHDGRRYLECGGYGVFILGHRNPSVTSAVVRQVTTHPLATRVLLEPVAARAAKAVADLTHPGLEYVHFVPSGSEATEAAIKMARGLGKRRLISTINGFHGKTMGALSVTAREIYQTPFEPLLPDRSHVPFGDIDALRGELVAAPGECCVIMEPVQGEGGVILPPDGYLREVREACDEYDATLIFDEILTGMGRCGQLWACGDVAPDIMLVGKGLSGGVVPVAAAVATPEAYALINRDPLLHSSTFSCAPVAMAAAEAAAHAIVEQRVPERAAELGPIILDGLREIFDEVCPHLVEEVRGTGLLFALEFKSGEFAGEFLFELLDRGVVTNHSLNASSVIRITPPACLSEADLDWLFSAVRATAEHLAGLFPTGG